MQKFIKNIFLIALIVLGFFNKSFSGVTVSQGTATVTEGSSAWVTITDIQVTTSLNNDIPRNLSNATYVLQAPTGFEFNAGVGSVTGFGAGITAISVTVTAANITVYVSTNNVNAKDVFIISGVELRPTTGTSGVYDVTYVAASSTATSVVADGTVHAVITCNAPPVNVITLGSVVVTEDECSWNTVSDIVITEGGVSNFAASQTNQTYVLTFSNTALFDFNTAAGSVSVSPVGDDITASSITVTADVVTITLSTDGSANQVDAITVSGLQIISTGATSGAYTIIESGSGGSWSQVASSVHANITVNANPVISGGDGAFTDGDASWVTVSDIVINENVATNFRPSQTNETYVIAPPAGFAFNTGVAPTVTSTGGTSLTVNGNSFSGGSLVLDLTTDGATDQVDEITISGLQVQLTASVPTAYLQYDCATSTGNWGMIDGGDATVNHGTLTVAGIITITGGIGTFYEGDATPVAISDIVIDESAAGNFSPSGTFVIVPPAGFTFQAGVGSASVTGAEVNIIGTVVTSSDITIVMNVSGTSTVDVITITGVNVILGAATAGEYYPTFDIGSSSQSWGLSGGEHCGTFTVKIPPSITGGLGTFTQGDATPVAISDIVIDEGSLDNFSSSGTYVILPPAGFTFDVGVGSASVTAGTDIAVNSTTVLAGSITIDMTVGASTTIDEITITGINGIIGAATVGTYYPTYDAGTSTGSWQVSNGEYHGTFTVINPPTFSGGVGAFSEGDATPVTITDIIVDEVVLDNFSASGTFVIVPPAGFTFQAGVGSASVTGGTDVTVNSTTVTAGAITIDMTVGATATVDEITITGITVIIGAATGGTYYPTFDLGISTGTWGLYGGESCGTFTVAGAIYSNGTGGGNWNAGASWDGGVVPSATDIAIIRAGDIINLTSNPTCVGLIVRGTLTDAANPGNILTINGNFTLDGSGANEGLLDANANGTLINVNGDATVTDGIIKLRPSGAGGDVRISGDLTVNGASTLTDSSSNNNQEITVTGNLSVSVGATCNVGGCNFDITGTTTLDGELAFAGGAAGDKIFRNTITVNTPGTWVNENGETIDLNCDFVIDGNFLGCMGTNGCLYEYGEFIPGVYTITGTGSPFQGSVINVFAGTEVINLHDVNLEADQATGVLTGGGIFTNSTSGVLKIGSPSGGVAGTDEVDITTFNATAIPNYVHFQKPADQAIPQPTDGSYYNLLCENGGVKTLVDPTVTVNNLLTITDATLNVATNTLNGTGGILAQGTADLQIAKLGVTVPELTAATGDYSFNSASTLTLNGAGAQTYNNVPTDANAVWNLVLGGSGAKTIDGITVVSGDITVQGTAAIASHSAFVQVSTGTTSYNSTATTTLTAATPITIGSYVQTNGVLIDNGINITVTGTFWNKTGGTFTATGTAIFDNATGTTVSDGSISMTTFNNVTINAGKVLIADATDMGVSGVFNNNSGLANGFQHNTGEVTFSGASSIIGDETTFYSVEILSGTLTGHATNFNVEGDWTYTAGTYTAGTGKVTFTGNTATQTVSGLTTSFYDVEIDKASTDKVNATANITVTNELLITEGILDMNTQTLSGAGGLTMLSGDLQMAKLATAIPELTGTYTLSGGIVTLDGGGNQTLRPSVTYYNLLYTTSGVKTMTNVLAINGDFTVAGTATIGPHSSFVQASDKTLYYTSTGVTILTAATPITIGSYNQTAGTFDLNGIELTVTGANWNKTAGTCNVLSTSRLIFNGTVAQTYKHLPVSTIRRATIDNPNGVTLNSLMYISINLDFIDGNIITGANLVNMTAVTSSVTRTGSGHVEGYLRKAYDASNKSKIYEVGTGVDYSPIEISFATVSSSGVLTARAISGDHFDIFSSDINPSKSVNRYWEVSLNTVGFTTYDVTLYFNASDVDGSASTSDFSVYKSSGGVWSDLNTGANIDAQPLYTKAQGIADLTSGSQFAVGEKIDPSNVLNAVAGAMNWNNQDNWIRLRSGLITYTAGATAVTGNAQTKFLSEICAGDILMLESSPTTQIGTVVSVTDDQNLVLTPVGALITGTNEAFGMKCIPGNVPTCVLAAPGTSPYTDFVVIGNPSIGAAVDVTIDAAPNNIYRLRFNDQPYSTSLDNNGYTLNISSYVQVRQPSQNGETNIWNINNGRADVSGYLRIASDDGTAPGNRIAKVVINGNGYLKMVNGGSNINFDNRTYVGTGVLDMSGAIADVATVEYHGTGITMNNNLGTITPGTNSIFNYVNGTQQQTINFGSQIKYNTITLNNTFDDATYDGTINDGIVLGADITALNVTGDLYVQSGIFDNNGYDIVGNAGKTFAVQTTSKFLIRDDGVTATSFPSGFGTVTLDATSEVRYLSTVNSNVSDETYGILYLTPLADAVTLTLDAGTLTTVGNMYLGNGTNTAIVVDANTNGTTVNANKNVTLYPNTTYSSDNLNPISVGGNWNNQGGTFTHNNGTIKFNGTIDQEITGTPATQTFNNMTLDKTAGVLTVTGSTTTLTVNNYSHGQGTFTSPDVFNVNGSLTLSSGTLNAGAGVADGSYIYAKGNWTNNGGTFTHNDNIVEFCSTTAGQVINGSAATQTFGNVNVKNNGQTLSVGGSTTEITTSTLVLNSPLGQFTAPATINIGNLTITDGTYLAGTTTNLSGNMVYNGGTLTPGANQFVFNGTSDQTISGTATYSAFQDFTINNTSATGTEVTFNKPITVNGVLTLTDGNIVTTAVNLLAMGGSATVVGESDDSFVKGPMRYTISTTTTTTKIYPVGKGTKLHKLEMTIKQTDATATNYRFEYFDSDANALGLDYSAAGLERVSHVGYWTLTKGAGSAITSASVKLHYYTIDDVTDEANLRVAKGNAAWSDLGGFGTAPDAGTISSTINFFDGGYFSLANKVGGTNGLPVELLSFDAELYEEEVRLNWITASEKDNDYFIVQRTQDNISFEDIAYVQGNGNSNEMIKYDAVDENPLIGISYYRLKQVDFNGEFSLSDIVVVNFSKVDKADVRLYPNPAEFGQEVYFNISGLDSEKEVLVVVIDMLGREMYSKVVFTDYSGSVVTAIDPYERLPKGTYMIIGSSNDMVYSKKLIIK